jgi:GTP-binding protein
MQHIRNIAIIAHVDHGKTTLVDCLLKQSGTFRANEAKASEERIMDSMDLEREKGITIRAKNAAFKYKNYHVNIVDTPGHADFGGEVERIMNMIDGVLLVVDAADGPQAQTRFVLRKALELGRKAIVVINKIDRPNSRPDWVANATFDLFVELGASDEQADFPIVHTNALTGCAVLPHKGDKPVGDGCDLQPLFDLILDFIPQPVVDAEASGQMLITSLAYDEYKGRIAIGRLFSGTFNKNHEIVRITSSGAHVKGRLQTIFTHQGLSRVEVPSASAGDIIAVTGLDDMYIGETIADAKDPKALPTIKVEEPTVRMTFGVNSSPFAGREGTWGTSRKLRERLYKELEQNVALKVEDGESADSFVVSGRGELHLVILIETMRREGYEFQVGKPEVIFKKDDAGQTVEPYENVFVEVPEEYQGAIMEMLGSRQGQMTNMVHGDNGIVSMEYKVPTRGLLGFRSSALTATRGTVVMNTLLAGYEPLSGEIHQRDRGSLVAWEDGDAITYGLRNAWERGVLFIESGTPVYEGMVVGENARNEDLDVNVCKTKVLSAVRTRSSDHETSRLPPIRQMSLDNCIEYIADDEMVEVTPENIRIRKKILKRDDRNRLASQRAKALRDA